MQIKSTAECSWGSILQYFRSALSDDLSLRFLFCLFLNGRLKQVLLFVIEASIKVFDLAIVHYILAVVAVCCINRRWLYGALLQATKQEGVGYYTITPWDNMWKFEIYLV